MAQGIDFSNKAKGHIVGDCSLGSLIFQSGPTLLRPSEIIYAQMIWDGGDISH